MILVRSSTECSSANFCTFLLNATNFNAVICEFDLRGVGSFSNENCLKKFEKRNGGKMGKIVVRIAFC